MDKSLAFPRLRIIFFQELGEEEMVTSMRFDQQMATHCDALALVVIDQIYDFLLTLSSWSKMTPLEAQSQKYS